MKNIEESAVEEDMSGGEGAENKYLQEEEQVADEVPLKNDLDQIIEKRVKACLTLCIIAACHIVDVVVGVILVRRVHVPHVFMENQT